ncbi:beta-glucuronidase [Vallitalea longa]|uniref:Beta-glucuronidase n=1 Tax=Vallitalea longa TaxID=2936439 RepID=A0A9W6DEQ7_9FIRM|nr:beta-glucuronidase [Vallitalea longa]GKX29775.1 beta-glucuronidase [Vallitalea longa]
MLYPVESYSREVKDLSGIWNFKLDKNNKGREEKWYFEDLQETILMPVPSSYNDITQNKEIKDHIGDVWYERKVIIPKSWHNQRIILRVGSATHYGIVWVNGKKVAEHKGGYLPFEAEINEYIEYGRENRITICVNNVLDWTTLPPGEVVEMKENHRYPNGHKVQKYFHDFYNYAGLHRPIKIYTTPKIFIKEVDIDTDIENNDGIIDYDIVCNDELVHIKVSIFDKDNKLVGMNLGLQGNVKIPDAILWKPGHGYLYKMVIHIILNNEIVDEYCLNVGIRTVCIRDGKFLINNEPMYFRGFGKHEDMDIKGKGLDNSIIIKDFNLMNWIGANSFRTSHYPYAEEVLQVADKLGIMVIDESPAVGMTFFNEDRKVFVDERINDVTLEHHLNVMDELINRDKNHPSVVMWSVANEPSSWEDGAVPYFTKVAARTRELDDSRPMTMVNYAFPYGEKACKVAGLFDVICLNKYYSWYEDCGQLDLIEYQLENELQAWHDKFDLPIIMTEYGADTIQGLHSDPPEMFTEEYQCEMLKSFHRVFDRLDYVIGEQIWNFADFATKQGTTRIMGNRKGIFTRQRQPKVAAHMMKKRWHTF